MTYEDLLIEADMNDLIVRDKPLKAHDGRIMGNKIAIRKDMTNIQKKCVLAEELGHHYTSTGNILDQEEIDNRKQEYRARLIAYNRLVDLWQIVKCYKYGCRNLYEMAEHLDVTEEFLLDALECYRSIYGTYAQFEEYLICFEPSLSVMKLKT